MSNDDDKVVLARRKVNGKEVVITNTDPIDADLSETVTKFGQAIRTLETRYDDEDLFVAHVGFVERAAACFNELPGALPIHVTFGAAPVHIGQLSLDANSVNETVDRIEKELDITRAQAQQCLELVVGNAKVGDRTGLNGFFVDDNGILPPRARAHEGLTDVEKDVWANLSKCSLPLTEQTNSDVLRTWQQELADRLVTKRYYMMPKSMVIDDSCQSREWTPPSVIEAVTWLHEVTGLAGAKFACGIVSNILQCPEYAGLHIAAALLVSARSQDNTVEIRRYLLAKSLNPRAGQEASETGSLQTALEAYANCIMWDQFVYIWTEMDNGNEALVAMASTVQGNANRRSTWDLTVGLLAQRGGETFEVCLKNIAVARSWSIIRDLAPWMLYLSDRTAHKAIVHLGPGKVSSALTEFLRDRPEYDEVFASLHAFLTPCFMAFLNQDFLGATSLDDLEPIRLPNRLRNVPTVSLRRNARQVHFVEIIDSLFEELGDDDIQDDDDL